MTDTTNLKPSLRQAMKYLEDRLDKNVLKELYNELGAGTIESHVVEHIVNKYLEQNKQTDKNDCGVRYTNKQSGVRRKTGSSWGWNTNNSAWEVESHSTYSSTNTNVCEVYVHPNARDRKKEIKKWEKTESDKEFIFELHFNWDLLFHIKVRHFATKITKENEKIMFKDCVNYDIPITNIWPIKKCENTYILFTTEEFSNCKEFPNILA